MVCRNVQGQVPAEEWDQLVAHLEGDIDKAKRAHLSLCRNWEQIWDVNAPRHTETEEKRLSQLSDEELLDEWHRAEIESPLTDLIAGEMERRNLDD